MNLADAILSFARKPPLQKTKNRAAQIISLPRNAIDLLTRMRGGVRTPFSTNRISHSHFCRNDKESSDVLLRASSDEIVVLMLDDDQA
jgi:hypothetical protein